ncbi:ATP-grasp domain-containing protein [Longispora fulva]|uniref:ATP-grasp domain-containing protein n=1 Tax=Longispora fulva TaxID=619741 RepID=A0A8J7KU04_9ACTN|nr:hypothetical protein [Longispora fulva]MBG6141312.1 hypothetical protein [Longispora fulva]GIG59537.1 ATP-grasp domain-containing protein [Longispora fulva]
MKIVALATCAKLPELDEEERLVLGPLSDLGIRAVPAVWDDPTVDWSSFDLTVLRTTWDYATRRDEFLTWAHTVPHLLNPAATVEANTDKRYLASLAVPTVPTVFLAPGEAFTAPDGEYVLKPTVSAGSLDTGRYGPADAPLAAAHVARLHAAGRTVMVQPYLAAVDDAGETALLYFNGEFSHAIRKGPMLTGPDLGTDALFHGEEITARVPSAAERALGDALVGTLDAPLYARVDLIPGPDGTPVLVELELTEPSLFLGQDAGAPARFARAIAARL